MRQERSERTRRNLVGAASTVFDQSGYERATLSAISERARVTKGALSFHFAAKADLARAVQADACAVSGAALAEIARRETPAFEIATAMTHTVVRLVESDALVRAGARLTQEIRTPDDPALHVHLNWLGALHGALRRAKADGSLLREVDVPTAASLLLSLITGTTTLPHITDRDPTPSYWAHRPSPEPGARQHETGDGLREAGDGQHDSGDRRRDLGDRLREAGDGQHETGDRLRKAEDRQHDSGDLPRDLGDRPREAGGLPRDFADRPRETGDQWLTRALHLIRPALSHPRAAP